MKNKSVILSLLAAVLIMCAVIVPAKAYFTANSNADGSVGLDFQSRTEIWEEVVGLKKSLQIRNTGADDENGNVDPERAALTEPVWVRARAYAGVTYPLSIEGEGWTPETEGSTDCWFYYKEPISAGEMTGILTVEVTGIPKPVSSDTVINVIVIHETIPVTYKEDGTYDENVNWDQILDTGTTGSPEVVEP